MVTMVDAVEKCQEICAKKNVKIVESSKENDENIVVFKAPKEQTDENIQRIYFEKLDKKKTEPKEKEPEYNKALAWLGAGILGLSGLLAKYLLDKGGNQAHNKLFAAIGTVFSFGLIGILFTSLYNLGKKEAEKTAEKPSEHKDNVVLIVVNDKTKVEPKNEDVPEVKKEVKKAS